MRGAVLVRARCATTNLKYQQVHALERFTAVEEEEKEKRACQEKVI
jgi:hypothetical protein